MCVKSKWYIIYATYFNNTKLTTLGEEWGSGETKMGNENRTRIQTIEFMKQILKKLGIVEYQNFVFQLQERFGHSERYVKELLERMEMVGLLQLKGDIITWMNHEEPKSDAQIKKDAEEEAEVDYLLKEQKYTPADREEPIPKDDNDNP